MKIARLNLESLENRTCPSVAFQGHVLTVTGTSGADQIVVRDGGHGNSTRSYSSVQKIVINSQGGNDKIEYAMTAPLTVAEQIVINAGPGNNVINLNFSKGISAPSLSVQVQAGTGDDTLSATFGSIVNTNLSFNANLGNGFDHCSVALNGDVTGSAKVAVALTGGANFNGLNVQERGTIGAAAQVSLVAKVGAQMSTVHLDYTGKLLGKLTVQALGGASTDWIESTINLATGSTGSLTDRENGGAGDDQLVLKVNATGSHLKLLDALADGGGGTDYCIHTPNVRTTHISA
jgi:hypothetical protein